MKDEDILKLAEPYLSMRDTAQPMIRGREALCEFARAVLLDNYLQSYETLLASAHEFGRFQDPA